MRTRLITLALILPALVAAGGVSAEAGASMPGSTGCAAWLDSLRTEGLALPGHEMLALALDPLPSGSPLTDPSSRYGELLQAIDRKRDELATRYRSASPGPERGRILEVAGEHLEAIIGDMLFPSWLGVGWDFFGVPGPAPSLDRPVACGHFIQKLLEDAGFNTQKRAGTWLAYLAPRDFLESVGGCVPDDVLAWEGVSARLEERGPGLYLLGLESWWGHIGLLRLEPNGDLWFLHSGPHFQGASVSMDDGELYLREFLPWQHVWVMEFDSAVVLKWLEGTAIVPCVVMD